MPSIRTALIILVLVAAAFSAPPGFAQPADDPNRTLSPYFFIKSDDAGLDQLPLKSTSADVAVAGVIADVTVTQIYRNEGKKPLEAVYIFPASTRAAVYGMKMTLGKRTLIARIEERQEARRQYEQARQEGRSASLLEQQRPNVFQMNVANILPGDEIRVELRYTELLVPTEGVYEFVYPTVVGPRYSNQPAAGAPPSQAWVENPYFRQGEPPSSAFSIKLNLATGLPLQQAGCPSHKVKIHYDGPSRASVELDPSEKQGGNRDFVLHYRLAGGKVQSGLLLFEGERENFFLLMMEPPKRPRASEIPPREYIFIVDVSGSMNGFPIEMSKKLFRDLIGGLRPVDRFNVLLFSGGSSVLSERSLSATAGNIRQAVDLIERQRGGGGTELLPALKRALSLPRDEGCSRTVVIATDGYVAVEEEAFDLIRNHLGDANMFTFGIGTAVNRYLLEGMARVGMGEPFVISRPEETQEKAERFRKMIEAPVLTGVRVDFGGFEVYDVEPATVPDVFAERPVTVFGKWRGRPRGEITLRGITGEGPYTARIDVRKESPGRINAGLAQLWARHRIALLSDYNALRRDGERVKEVTRLGLQYNLLTAYTSFVAVDTEVRLVNGQAVTVRQPLPLPQGVSDAAVGGDRAVLKASSFGRLSAPAAAAPQEAERQLVREEKAKDESPRGRVELGEIVPGVGSSKEALQKVLKKHLPSIEPCYLEALKRREGLAGEAIFRIRIDRNGRVIQADLVSSTVAEKKIEKCLIEKLKEIRFTVPEGVSETRFTVTLRLRAS
jgi:Ca-activated chloride channel family protein